MQQQVNFRNHRRRHLKRQSGVALLIALFAITMTSFIAVELSYDVGIEYIISNKEYHRLRAYYAAKSGIEISRFRLYIYKQIVTQFQSQIAGKQQLVDLLWNFPLVWPITSVLPEDIGRVERESMQKTVDASLMGSAQYSTQILSEGSKIDINDLASPVAALKEVTQMRLMSLFANSMLENEDIKRRFEDLDYQRVIINITDWVDENTTTEGGGGDESYPYADVIANNDIRGRMPPNRPFRTLQELNMVSGVSNTVYNFLAPHITIYGQKGINPNYASHHLLKALSPNITDEVIAQIEKAKADPSQGLFQNEQDFYDFLENFTNVQEIKDQEIPFYFGSEHNFMIKSTGISANAQKDIIAIVYDVDAVASNLSKSIAAANRNPNPNPNSPSTPSTANPNQAGRTNNTPQAASSGLPTIVYWYEP